MIRVTEHHDLDTAERFVLSPPRCSQTTIQAVQQVAPDHGNLVNDDGVDSAQQNSSVVGQRVELGVVGDQPDG